MTTREVHTQEELDQAIADKIDVIEIRSPDGVWLTISKNGSSRVVARESSHVEAWESSRVEARGSSHVEARESSRVEAWESSSVVARGSSHVVARGSSTVVAWESSSVVARGSSHVVARGSSSVVARESSHVEAWESSRVEAWESSSVVARESSHVEAWESSSVVARGSSSAHAHDRSNIKAAPLVAVFLHSSTAVISGGVILDHSHLADMDGKAWCEYHGVQVSRGIATLYKAVNDHWTTSRGVDYSPGSKPSCDDFEPTNECGNGLHFGPTPLHAKAYLIGATKFVSVGVKVAELQPIYRDGDVAKCKAPRVVRACVEVDIDGKPVAPEPAGVIDTQS